MKKTLALTLAAAMTLSLAACGSSASSASSAATSTESTSTDTSAATSTAAESGTVENKDKPLVWFNRQPSNSTTGELDTEALNFNGNTYYVGFDANQGAELQGKMIADYIKAHADTIDRNGDGVIVTHDGYVVQPEITIPDDAVEIYVNNSGEVWIKQDGETDETNVGQLELATFPNEAGLEAMGQNLFLETEASGAPIIDNPDTESFGSVLQGYLETSNVNPVAEITELVSAQRAYEMNSKIIQTSDQMLSTITSLR